MNKQNAKIIGFITVMSYVANYFLRNMLGVLTPAILKATSYTKEYIAFLSSMYMIAYAAGQLLNGVLGDIFKPRSMVLVGLSAAAFSMILFPFSRYRLTQIVCFTVLGYGLSMLRGPLMKIISENTKPAHARVICVFFSFSSFAGPLIAGLFAMIFKWKAAFAASGIATLAVAAIAYIALTILENKGMVTFKQIKNVSLKEMLDVFKIDGFVFYIIIACLVEIAGISISFWIPTLLNEYVEFDETKSNMVFSFISFARALIPFAALAIFKLFNENDTLIIKISYAISLVSFLLMAIIPPCVFSIIFLLLALVMSSLVSALLWSIYIPGLGKTGRVSSINGILDCGGYIAASISTTIFAHVVSTFGWKGLIIAWMMIPTVGLVTVIKRTCK